MEYENKLDRKTVSDILLWSEGGQRASIKYVPSWRHLQERDVDCDLGSEFGRAPSIKGTRGGSNCIISAELYDK